MIKDEELMLAYQSGNSEALEEIFLRYKARILNFALRILSNLADAEDVVGETFFILTRKKSSYEPKAKFSTWIYTISHNLCIDRIRRRKKTTFLWFLRGKGETEEEIIMPDLKPLQDTHLEKGETRDRVRASIGKLSLKYKEAIILREYQNLSYQEISGVLGCSLSEVKMRIFRAREKLRKELLPFVKGGE